MQDPTQLHHSRSLQSVKAVDQLTLQEHELLLRSSCIQAIAVGDACLDAEKPATAELCTISFAHLLCVYCVGFAHMISAC